ncbi:MAG: hypothetical protein Q4F81_00190 [Eubacteriales bacterium]|nr:hypothetical protein [Eubacteriales bacterium]
MDLENNQDFDLEDILKEFGDHPEEEPAAPAGQMPELRLDEEPAAAAEEPSEEPKEPSLPDTQEFAPVGEEAPEAPPAADEPTIVVDLSEERTEEAPQPAVAEPAFEVEEEFIPAPIVFTPRSRLKELKKQLVAGPERRYYELSEMGTGRLQAALLVNVLVVLICAGVTALFALDLVPENRIKLVVFSQVLAMLVSAFLGSNLMLDSLGDLLKGRFTVNTLLTLTFAACLIDSVFCLKELRVPCCAAFSLEMTMALWARLQKHNTEMAQMDTMRKAVRLHGIVRVENYYEGKDGLLRKEGEVSDFMDTYNKTPSPEVVQSVYAVLSLLVCIGISIFAGMLHGLSMGVQILSTSLLVAVPASFFVSISRPMAILETRLHMVGTVLCGWEGVKDLCGKAVFPISDLDLFPQGSTKLNGVKFYGRRDPDEVVSYTASVIHLAGGGLVPVFDQLLKSRNGSLYPVHSFRNYGDGGIGGEVDGQPVLVGTMAFLQDMGVEIPEGTMVNQAVYAAVDGELCAVYAISYAKMRSAAAGLVTLCGYRKLKPLKLSGDFMLTESFLRSKFNVKTSRIAFPDRDTCQKLQQHPIDPEEPVLALTTREELVSSAYAITGARALRQATKLGVIIHLIGGTLGLIIMLVLGYLGSTELLTPANILLYQLIWAIPGLLVTEWARIV